MKALYYSEHNTQGRTILWNQACIFERNLGEFFKQKNY